MYLDSKSSSIGTVSWLGYWLKYGVFLSAYQSLGSDTQSLGSAIESPLPTALGLET